MSPGGKTRLLRLAAFLETIPSGQFDFGIWGEKKECGTSACALGWACEMPEFQEQFGVALTPWFAGKSELTFAIDGSRAEGCTVSSHLFDTELEEFDFLFLPGSRAHGYSGFEPDATASQVAAHIRRFVAEGIYDER